MKKIKITYWISTGLLTAFMLMSAGMYIFNYDEISLAFLTLGYPIYIIYPLAIAKILGLIAIWVNNSKSLKEWAYAGFFFDFVLAFFAHFMIGDDVIPPVMATVFLMVSYLTWKKISIAK